MSRLRSRREFVRDLGLSAAALPFVMNLPGLGFANQNARIKTEVKEGELTKSQAAALHKDDRQIRREERLMASQNGGHITKQEQKTLNQQENAVSKQIGK